MAPLPAAANVLQTVLQWSDGSDTGCTTTLNWLWTGSAPDATDAGNFATVLANLFLAHTALWDVDTALHGVVATDLNTNSGARGDAAVDGQGTGGSDVLPGGVSTVVNYSITRRYRGGKPRSYFPWGLQSNLAGRQGWATGYTANVAAAISAIRAGFIGQVEGSTTISNQANISYYEGSRVVTSPTTGRARNVPILRATPLVSPITSFSVAIATGSQRQRNR